jgi:hypothetical protein
MELLTILNTWSPRLLVGFAQFFSFARSALSTIVFLTIYILYLHCIITNFNNFYIVFTDYFITMHNGGQILLVEETGVPGENHQAVASH